MKTSLEIGSMIMNPLTRSLGPLTYGFDVNKGFGYKVVATTVFESGKDKTEKQIHLVRMSYKKILFDAVIEKKKDYYVIREIRPEIISQMFFYIPDIIAAASEDVKSVVRVFSEPIFIQNRLDSEDTSSDSYGLSWKLK